jgi:FkbM family methyltransferase
MGLPKNKFFDFKFHDGHEYTVPREMIGPFRECFFDDQYFSKLDVKSIPPSPIIIDIGANVGYAALYFFRKFPNAVIYSFEPMPFLQNQIIEKIKKYKNYRWHLMPYGIWKVNGMLELFTTSTDGFTSVSGLIKFPDSDKKYTVPVKRLDDFINEKSISQIDILKLDCEGAEYEILYSLPEKYFTQINKIALETHVLENHKTEDLIDYLKKIGYEVKFFLKKTTGHIWAQWPSKNKN